MERKNRLIAIKRRDVEVQVATFAATEAEVQALYRVLQLANWPQAFFVTIEDDVSVVGPPKAIPGRSFARTNRVQENPDHLGR